jgi:putative ABC transport system permease protein
MLARIIRRSLLKRPKPVLLMLVAIILGSAVATAFLGIQREISGKMALELRRYGANILLEPAAGDGAYLAEQDLAKIKTVFWKHNIVGFAPYLFGVAEFAAAGKHERGVLAGTWFERSLEVDGEGSSVQGVKVIAPWWSVTGGWPAAEDEAVIGAALARRLALTSGGTVRVAAHGKELALRIVGVVTTGGFEEEQLFAPLVTAQRFLERPGAVSRVLVSAMTVPMDDFGRKDPAAMSREEYEKWYCTAYVTSVAKNLADAVTGSRAKPVWQIAGAEGALLGKLNGVMLLLTLLALIAAAVGVGTSLLASMAERQKDIALMKTLGADRQHVTAIFMGETLFVALIGGCCGFLVGNRLAELVSRSVFASSLETPLWLLPIALAVSLLVAALGGILPLRRAFLVEPVKVLKG